MKRMSWLVLLLAIGGSTGCASNASVQPLSIGQQVDFSLLEDQRGNAFAHQQDMKLVLYVDGMKAKNLVRDAFVDIDQSCLSEGRVVYLADISGMPSLISSLIAIPRMRNYPYPIWLDRTGLATDALPVQDDAVTVLTLEQQAVKAVDFVADTPSLLQRLRTECGPASQQMAQSGG